MTVNDLQYPIVCFTKFGLSTKTKPEYLAITFEKSFKMGWFQNLKILDSEGRSYMVKKATKLGGIGLLSGYSLFYNRRIRVSLDIEILKEQISLDEAKKIILMSFKEGSDSSTREDFYSLQKAISECDSFKKLLSLIC